MDWAQVLVIILAVFLAVFLVLAIVLTALFIKVTVQIKAITGAAERAALKLESVADNAAKFATPMAIFNVVSKFIKKNKSK
ncbi:MAG: hypothetical protein ABIP74_01580 [Candidatus Saccharimonas sp.]